jgi:hypothetical protein
MWPLASIFKAPKYYYNILHFDPPLSWQETNKRLGYNKDRNGAEINLSDPFFFTVVGNPRLCVVQAVVIGCGRGSEESDERCCRLEELLKGKCRAEWWKVFSSSRAKDCRLKGIAFTNELQIKYIFAPKVQSFILEVCHRHCVKSIIQCIMYIYLRIHVVKNTVICQMVSLCNVQHNVIYNYTFRPCKWVIIRLFVEPVRWLYNSSWGGDEISSSLQTPIVCCVFDCMYMYVYIHYTLYYSEFHFLYGLDLCLVYVNFWFIPSQPIRIPNGECLGFVDIANSFTIPNHYPWHRLEQCRAIFHCTSAIRK